MAALFKPIHQRAGARSDTEQRTGEDIRTNRSTGRRYFPARSRYLRARERAAGMLDQLSDTSAAAEDPGVLEYRASLTGGLQLSTNHGDSGMLSPDAKSMSIFAAPPATASAAWQ